MSPEVPLYFPLSTCQQSSSIGRARSCEIPTPDFCNNYEIRTSTCDPRKFPDSNPAFYTKADLDAGFAVVTTFEKKNFLSFVCLESLNKIAYYTFLGRKYGRKFTNKITVNSLLQHPGKPNTEPCESGSEKLQNRFN
jgi:hypothetical protein